VEVVGNLYKNRQVAAAYKRRNNTQNNTINAEYRRSKTSVHNKNTNTEGILKNAKSSK
jgi:hypothetical protein